VVQNQLKYLVLTTASAEGGELPNQVSQYNTGICLFADGDGFSIFYCTSLHGLQHWHIDLLVTKITSFVRVTRFYAGWFSCANLFGEYESFILQGLKWGYCDPFHPL